MEGEVEVDDEAVLELIYDIKVRWLGMASSEREYEQIQDFDVGEIRKTLDVLAPFSCGG
jgi:hypothetical protein